MRLWPTGRCAGGAFAPCSSPYTTPLLAEGAHTFAVRAIDAADHSDPTPATRSFTVSTGGGGAGAETLPSVASAVIAGGAFRWIGEAVGERPGAPKDEGRLPRRGAVLLSPNHSHGEARRRVGRGGSCERGQVGRLGIHRRGREVGARQDQALSEGLRLLKRRKRISAKVNITVTRVGKRTAKTVKVTLQAPRQRS